MYNIAIFASGAGTNAQKIIDYFKGSDSINIALVVSSKNNAFVLERAGKNNIPSLILDKQSFYESQNVLNQLQEKKINFIVLAGFLWMMPTYLISSFPKRIINIHPSLLPHFGGKGMYGMKVHEAVIDKHEKQSGITIHYVNEKYDEGTIIFQEKCTVEEMDTPETLAEKIHALEHKFYPEVIEKLLINDLL